MKTSWLALAWMLSIPIAARADAVSALALARTDPVPLQLDEAVALALRENRAIRSAHLKRVADRFDLRVARDRYAPQLLLKARYLRHRDQNDRQRDVQLVPAASLLTPFGTRLDLDWSYDHIEIEGQRPRQRDGANLTVVQPLLRGAGVDVATAPLRQAQLSEQLNRLALRETVGQTISQVILLYRALLRAQEQQKIADQALQRARRLVDVNRALIATGRMAAFDIVQTQAEVANQELARENSHRQLEESRLALAQTLAIDLSTPLLAVDEIEPRQVHLDATRALARAKALQPAYLMQQLTGEQLAVDLLLAKDQQRWDLSLVAGAAQAHERPGLQASWRHYVGLELAIPIGDLQARQAQVRTQVALQEHALGQAETDQQLQREIFNAVKDIQGRWRQLQIAGRALALSRRKLAIEQEKLSLGRSSNFEVLSFESDLRYAQHARLDAAIAYLNGQTSLDQLLGTTLGRWGVVLHD
ncbi:TolC family protein [Pseudomonas putida]|uniref:TolC family protein n=1 Tax=Pseudomonas putida TaxID=303 RepID=UPI002E2FB5EB|nr:TolC family protein [Pseudomonas putida]